MDNVSTGKCIQMVLKIQVYPDQSDVFEYLKDGVHEIFTKAGAWEKCFRAVVQETISVNVLH